jgi:hypothetical protein
MEEMRRCTCQLRPQNDNSWPQEDDSRFKMTTSEHKNGCDIKRYMQSLPALQDHHIFSVPRVKEKLHTA